MFGIRAAQPTAGHPKESLRFPKSLPGGAPCQCLCESCAQLFPSCHCPLERMELILIFLQLFLPFWCPTPAAVTLTSPNLYMPKIPPQPFTDFTFVGQIFRLFFQFISLGIVCPALGLFINAHLRVLCVCVLWKPHLFPWGLLLHQFLSVGPWLITWLLKACEFTDCNCLFVFLPVWLEKPALSNVCY